MHMIIVRLPNDRFQAAPQSLLEWRRPKHPGLNVPRKYPTTVREIKRTHWANGRQNRTRIHWGSYLKTTTASGSRQDRVNRWPAHVVACHD